MNWFEKCLYALQGKMEVPQAFGWFHCLCLLFFALIAFILFFFRKKHTETQFRFVMGGYSIVALILEILKQLIWSFHYDPSTQMVSWSYQWYSAPFQLCTTPIFVALACLFLKKSRLRRFLCSYLAYITILGSILTVFFPDSCFVPDILVNIHTMWLHYGSLVVSLYLLFSGHVEIRKRNLFKGLTVFLGFVFFAEILNIMVYESGILDGQTFNMFYISPYFISSLPVFSQIQPLVPFAVFLLTYIIAVVLGAFLIYGIALLCKTLASKFKHIEKTKKIL